MTLKSVKTRFRAYRLDTAGASFSHFADPHFTLIEARYTDENKRSIENEMRECGLDFTDGIDTLHITSWDQDHCVAEQLSEIIAELRPRVIEHPGYDPEKENGKKCLKLIKGYESQSNSGKIITRKICPEYLEKLPSASTRTDRDIYLGPYKLDAKPNNNSIVKLYRRGSFNVLSLGDLEDGAKSEALANYSIIRNEMDIMILAHHGANNGFTTENLLEKTKPKIAIASANWGNEYEHPDVEVKNMLNKINIPLFTTKTGDTLIESTGNHTGTYKLTKFNSSGHIEKELLNLKAKVSLFEKTLTPSP